MCFYNPVPGALPFGFSLNAAPEATDKKVEPILPSNHEEEPWEPRRGRRGRSRFHGDLDGFGWPQ